MVNIKQARTLKLLESVFCEVCCHPRFFDLPWIDDREPICRHSLVVVDGEPLLRRIDTVVWGKCYRKEDYVEHVFDFGPLFDLVQLSRKTPLAVVLGFRDAMVCHWLAIFSLLRLAYPSSKIGPPRR